MQKLSGAMDWNDLKYVLETVRCGGVSGAARVLGVNHATVSRRIVSAEISLGALLFDKLATGYVPTDAGLAAARTAESIETESAKLARLLDARDRKLSGPLIVTAPQLLCGGVLTELIADFYARYPDVETTLLASTDVLSLPKREADVAIRISKDPTETLFGTSPTEERVAVYTSPDYLNRLEKSPEHPLRLIMMKHWAEVPAEITGSWPNTETALVVSDLTSALGAAKAGLGAARLPCFLGEEDQGLVRLPGLPTFPYSRIWVLTHPNLKDVTRISVFMKFISSGFRSKRRLFEGR
ncbi:LysR family transcriptional regulator [Epibacterium ulvae]|nr:LysR family transcriptional regulator [Epibacterium ulvae]